MRSSLDDQGMPYSVGKYVIRSGEVERAEISGSWRVWVGMLRAVLGFVSALGGRSEVRVVGWAMRGCD